MSDPSSASRTPERPLWEQLADAAKDAALTDGVRLQKVLAERGFGSRRVSEQLIAEGRVTVNGDVAVLGRRVHVDVDDIQVDASAVGVRPGLVYFLLNKPAGVVSTASDTHGRPTVVDLVPDDPRVYPVGRLDAETEGLIILTNDGDFTHRLTHPSFGVEKEYLATLDGALSPSDLTKLRNGVELADGMTAPAQVSQPQPGVLRIAIHEGRNRQVRRMCEAVGHPVVRLVRVRIGTISDRGLAPGAWRALSLADVRAVSATATPPGR